MIAFQVNDMTCGHCVGAITKAVKEADPQAQVAIDLATHRVNIESAALGAPALGKLIEEAGYTPTPIAAAPTTAGRPAGGCGGGCACR